MALPNDTVNRPPMALVPRGRLLATIPELTATSTTRGAAWLDGVSWIPYICSRNPTFDFSNPCTPIAFSTDSADVDQGCVGPLSQSAFRVYEILEGSTLDFKPGDLEEALRERVPFIESWAFARALANGVSTTVSLKSAATAPAQVAFGGAAVPAKRAISVLTDELARRLHAGRGIIHMPPGMVEFANVKEPDDDVSFETKLGHKVVADAGYVDMPAPTGQLASPDGTEWIYASGPVGYLRSGARITEQNASQEFTMERNLLRQHLSDQGLLVFDPCTVTAVLASYA